MSDMPENSIQYIDQDAPLLDLDTLAVPCLRQPRPSQLQMTRAMLDREQQALMGVRMQKSDITTLILFSITGCLNQPTGTGKTLATLLLIMSGQQPPNTGGYFLQNEPSAFAAQYVQHTAPAYARTLVVLGKNLMVQWKRECEQAGGSLRTHQP